MNRKRPLLIAVAAALAGAYLSAQSNPQPSFAGKWTLIEERSVPAGGTGALGPVLTIEQTTSAITIARVSRLTAMVKDASGRDVPQTIERATTNTYTFDGVERELVSAAQQMAVGRGGQGGLDLTSTYRSVWTTGQLVVMSFGRATASLAARTKDQIGQLKQVGRLSLSLEPDGTLAVDRVTILDPEANGPKENAPVALKSYYRREK